MKIAHIFLTLVFTSSLLDIYVVPTTVWQQFLKADKNSDWGKTKKCRKTMAIFCQNQFCLNHPTEALIHCQKCCRRPCRRPSFFDMEMMCSNLVGGNKGINVVGPMKREVGQQRPEHKNENCSTKKVHINFTSLCTAPSKCFVRDWNWTISSGFQCMLFSSSHIMWATIELICSGKHMCNLWCYGELVEYKNWT